MWVHTEKTIMNQTNNTDATGVSSGFVVFLIITTNTFSALVATIIFVWLVKMVIEKYCWKNKFSNSTSTFLPVVNQSSQPTPVTETVPANYHSTNWL